MVKFKTISFFFFYWHLSSWAICITGQEVIVWDLAVIKIQSLSRSYTVDFFLNKINFFWAFQLDCFKNKKDTKLDKSSVFKRFRLLPLLLLLVLLMKDDLASLGLQPGRVIDVAFDRPGTFSRISWQPMSLTSKVPETR